MSIVRFYGYLKSFYQNPNDPSLATPSVFKLEFLDDESTSGCFRFSHVTGRWPTLSELFKAVARFIWEIGTNNDEVFEFVSPCKHPYRLLKVACPSAGYDYVLETCAGFTDYSYRHLLHVSGTERINYDLTIPTLDLFWLACDAGYIFPLSYDRAYGHFGVAKLTPICRIDENIGKDIRYVVANCYGGATKTDGIVISRYYPRDIDDEPGWRFANECPFFGPTVRLTADEYNALRRGF